MSKFYLFPNASVSQMFGCLIKTENHTIVIDGGTIYDAEQLYNFLKDNNINKIDGWFFTHPHHDHIGCFIQFNKIASDVEISKIFYCFPEKNFLEKQTARFPLEQDHWNDYYTWEKRYNTHKIKRGDVLTYDDVEIQVLRVYNPEIQNNFINNVSAVYKIKGNKKSVLILGDLGVEGGDELLSLYTPNHLKTDYTQLAHHGQKGVSYDFYKKIKPTRCIWASPLWLWNNDLGAGFNTAQFQTVLTRSWMNELGAIEHLIEKDGLISFEI